MLVFFRGCGRSVVNLGFFFLSFWSSMFLFCSFEGFGVISFRIFNVVLFYINYLDFL